MATKRFVDLDAILGDALDATADGLALWDSSASRHKFIKLEEHFRGLPDGTVGAPALAFGADRDSGLYRIGANNLGVSVNGAKVLDISATGLGIVSTDAGAAQDPTLDLYRNSASPAAADILAGIDLAGNSSTGVKRRYGTVSGRIVSATNGAEEGAVDVYGMAAGTSTLFGAFTKNTLTIPSLTATLVLGSLAGAANQSEVAYNNTFNRLDFINRRDGAGSDHVFSNAGGVMARIRRDGATGQSALRLSEAVATVAGGAAVLLWGSTATFGIYAGSGAPTIAAGQGSIYIRSDGSSTSTRLYVNTDGNTTWTNFTSAA